MLQKFAIADYTDNVVRHLQQAAMQRMLVGTCCSVDHNEVPSG